MSVYADTELDSLEREIQFKCWSFPHRTNICVSFCCPNVRSKLYFTWCLKCWRMSSQTWAQLYKLKRTFEDISLSLRSKNICIYTYSNACHIFEWRQKCHLMDRKIKISFENKLIREQISQQLLNVCYSSPVLSPSVKLLCFLKLKIKGSVLLQNVWEVQRSSEIYLAII